MKKLSLALIAVFALTSTAFAADVVVASAATKTAVKAPAKHSKSHTRKAKKASKASSSSSKALVASVATKAKA